MIDLLKLQEIKKAAIVALFSDDYLMNKLVLKGGTCLELAYKLHHRASKDIDFSIEDSFTDITLLDLTKRIEKQFLRYFLVLGYHAFDIKLKDKPRKMPNDIKMSGYSLSFKLISSAVYDKYENNLEKLRSYALCLGSADKKDFVIEISKFEYIDKKTLCEIDGHKILVYSPTLLICEKLRAICQKMKEYRDNDNDLNLPRARDFYDIYVINETLVHIDFKNPDNKLILQEVFRAKNVNLSLLFKIKDKRVVHEDDFKNVLLTDFSQKALPKIFDYYFEYVLSLIEDLQEFRIE